VRNILSIGWDFQCDIYCLSEAKRYVAYHILEIEDITSKN